MGYDSEKSFVVFGYQRFTSFDVDLSLILIIQVAFTANARVRKTMLYSQKQAGILRSGNVFITLIITKIVFGSIIHLPWPSASAEVIEK